MKKTLVAAAILAASGASFAQATVTGTLNYSYLSTKTAGVSSSGFGFNDANVYFKTSEDLGGGLKAGAQLSIAGLGRVPAGAASSITGEDAFITLSGGFGSVKAGVIDLSNGLLPIGSSGAAGIGVDGPILAVSGNGDIVAYSVPVASALTFGVNYTEPGAIGVGASGLASGQPGVTAGVTYATGPVTAKVDYTKYTRNDDADVTSNASSNRYRLSAAYDLGAARLSGGYSHKIGNNDAVTNEMLFGVAVPAGAVTFGLDYATSKSEAGGNTTADKSGFSAAVSYALSKRTSMTVSYLTYKDSKAANTDDNTATRLTLGHTF